MPQSFELHVVHQEVPRLHQLVDLLEKLLLLLTIFARLVVICRRQQDTLCSLLYIYIYKMNPSQHLNDGNGGYELHETSVAVKSKKKKDSSLHGSLLGYGYRLSLQTSPLSSPGDPTWYGHQLLQLLLQTSDLLAQLDVVHPADKGTERSMPPNRTALFTLTDRKSTRLTSSHL